MELLIEDAFVISGKGLVVTGRVLDGDIRTGDHLWLTGDGEPVSVTVRGIERLCFRGGDRDRAGVGTNAGLLIAGVEADAVVPGMRLADARP